MVAFELSWLPYAVMALRQATRARRNLIVRRADFLTAPLEGARVFVCYLFPGAMQALAPKLLREAAGARVVTHTFGIRGWAAESQVDLGDLFRTPVYVYRIEKRLTAGLEGVDASDPKAVVRQPR